MKKTKKIILSEPVDMTWKEIEEEFARHRAGEKGFTLKDMKALKNKKKSKKKNKK